MLINDTSLNKHDCIYDRVSTKKQKETGDLERQINNIKLFAISHNPINLKEFSDIGSGLDDNRKQLNQLLKLVQEDKVNRIFIMYKDTINTFLIQLHQTTM